MDGVMCDSATVLSVPTRLRVAYKHLRIAGRHAKMEGRYTARYPPRDPLWDTSGDPQNDTFCSFLLVLHEILPFSRSWTGIFKTAIRRPVGRPTGCPRGQTGKDPSWDPSQGSGSSRPGETLRLREETLRRVVSSRSREETLRRGASRSSY